MYCKITIKLLWSSLYIYFLNVDIVSVGLDPHSAVHWAQSIVLGILEGASQFIGKVGCSGCLPAIYPQANK